MPWFNANCVVIHGENVLSVFLNQTGATATFYLAQIGPQYAGHIMNIQLFDPGEGSHYIQVLDPTGNPVSFNYATVDDNTGQADSASAKGFSPYSGSVSASPGLDVSGCITPPNGFASGSKYSDRNLALTLPLPSDYTAPNGGWYQIKYTALTSPTACSPQAGQGQLQVSDRTTWSVSILGSPIHLVS